MLCLREHISGDEMWIRRFVRDYYDFRRPRGEVYFHPLCSSSHLRRCYIHVPGSHYFLYLWNRFRAKSERSNRLCTTHFKYPRCSCEFCRSNQRKRVHSPILPRRCAYQYIPHSRYLRGNHTHQSGAEIRCGNISTNHVKGNIHIVNEHTFSSAFVFALFHLYSPLLAVMEFFYGFRCFLDTPQHRHIHVTLSILDFAPSHFQIFLPLKFYAVKFFGVVQQCSIPSALYLRDYFIHKGHNRC